MARVAEIWRYPVKSMAGERLESCVIEATGLVGDRRWALVDGTPNRAGKPLTIREHDKLLTYRARLEDGGAKVVGPDGAVHAVDAGLARLLAKESLRPLRLRDLAGANFDASPLLIVNLASVRAFAAEAGMHVDHRRFRANLYVDGLDAFEEVSWVGRQIHVGDVRLQVVARDVRCVVITRDPDTTAATPALLSLLGERHDTCMGVYCQVSRSGQVAVGDSAELG
ncbi:MAG: MOSC domain-containing protein [Candidatus Dormibacterales bacterium]